MLPTTSLGPFTLNISTDAPQLTLVAVDANGKAAPNFTWNWLQACTNAARRSAGDASQLRVVVLNNPTQSDVINVEVSGVAGEAVGFDVVDMQGLLISQHRIGRAAAVERQSINVGRIAGVYLLKVQTADQTQTVKLFKQ